MYYGLSGLGLAYAYDQRDWFKLDKKETFTKQRQMFIIKIYIIRVKSIYQSEIICLISILIILRFVIYW